MSVRAIVAVLIGGALGTGLRLATDAFIPHSDSGFPLSTLVVNIAGSFMLGLLVSALWPTASDWVRGGLGPGLLGGYTTFSAVMVSLVQMTAAGKIGYAAIYLVLTLLLGFVAAGLGLWIGGRADAVPIIEEDE